MDSVPWRVVVDGDRVPILGNQAHHAVPHGDAQSPLDNPTGWVGRADLELGVLHHEDDGSICVERPGECSGHRLEVEASGYEDEIMQGCQVRHWNRPSRSATAMAPPRSETPSFR